jgi:Cu2+-containing amine oxidase
MNNRIGIAPNELEIVGSRMMVNGRMIEDNASRRITHLIKNELEQIANTKDVWEKLYRDPRDGRYWELVNPQSEMQGGGPPALQVIERQSARQKYLLTES